jgi:hypothetical protein
MGADIASYPKKNCGCPVNQITRIYHHPLKLEPELNF